MFDAEGRDFVNVHDFIVGVAPLSCPTESLSQMLQFCLQINDFDDTGEVCANQLVRLLHSTFTMRPLVLALCPSTHLPLAQM
jgi:Ca2+-binding EF-hand superfamily protein